MKNMLHLSLCALFTIACEPVIDSRGHNPDVMDPDKIKVLKSSKDDVQTSLGTPSIKAELDGLDVWYYISKKTATTSFFKPKIQEEKVLKIVFNKNGKVKNRVLLNKLNACDLEPNSDRTTSTGYEESVTGSLLDDLNRKFNSSKKQKTEN
jgi:outer membrane protein assembly factor BamE (lipoprotein component of BamABCDE complex)